MPCSEGSKRRTWAYHGDSEGNAPSRSKQGSSSGKRRFPCCAVRGGMPIATGVPGICPEGFQLTPIDMQRKGGLTSG